MRVVGVLVLWCVLLTGTVLAQGTGHSLPDCIGTICIEHQWVDAKPFFAKHGTGLACEGNFPKNWYYTGESLWVSIGRYPGEPYPINYIMVSKHALVPCYMPPPPKQPFGALLTEHSVGVGDTLEKVFQVYGDPRHEYSDPELVRRIIPSEWSGYDFDPITVLVYYPKDYSDEMNELPRLVLTVFVEKGFVIALSLESPPG